MNEGPTYLGVLSLNPAGWVQGSTASPSLLGPLEGCQGSGRGGPLAFTLSITPSSVEPCGPAEVPRGPPH